MSRTRPSLFLVTFAILVPLVAAPGCKAFSGKRQEPRATVLVANGPIKKGTPLTIEVVSEGQIPESLYTDTMLTPGDLELQRRRRIVHDLAKGQPIYFHNLEGDGYSDQGLGAKIRPGGRGYPIRLEAGAELDGWLRANEHVDILATVPRPAGGPGETITITLLENIVVLKTGERGTGVNNPDTNDFTFGSVTLLVLPEEAEMLLLAQKVGDLSLTLRNPDDRGLMQERAWTTLKTLLTRERAKKLRMQRIQTLDTIRILRGIGKDIPVPPQ